MPGTIIVFGASGYIGRRLIASLSQDGHHVIAVVRNPDRIRPFDSDAVEVRKADALDRDSLSSLPKEVDAVYYLIHSMTGSGDEFPELEQRSASNIAEYIKSTTAQQVIYLGGIANDDQLSSHLSSRQHVEEVLAGSDVPLTVLRAAIIVGSGSASFEIIRDLVEKLPVMIAPKWLSTRCQPVGIRDAIQDLVNVLLDERCFNKVFDLGGPDILTYKEMLQGFAKIRGLRRTIITVPVLTPQLSSLWLTLVTSVPFSLARSLVDSLCVEVVAQKEELLQLYPRKRLGYQEALAAAFDKLESSDVLSSWRDGQHSNYPLGLRVPGNGCFKDVRVVDLSDPKDLCRDRIFGIGGERGWYYGNWLWELRGYLDKIIGGAGLRRGRRNQDDVHAGEVIDFWRVLYAEKEQSRLLLYAEMLLPGEAWLEFKIVREEGKERLVQIATFRPLGLLGRLYWCLVWPLHGFIFPGMARAIAGVRN